QYVMHRAVDIPKSQLVLVDCDITSESLSCLVIHSSTANPTIQRCKIHHGKSNGILVYEGGQGTIEDCDIFGNAGVGVLIRDRGKPVIRQCKIHDGEQGGIWAYDNGQGKVENCDIFGNGKAGVEISQKSNLTVQGSKVHDG